MHDAQVAVGTPPRVRGMCHDDVLGLDVDGLAGLKLLLMELGVGRGRAVGAEGSGALIVGIEGGPETEMVGCEGALLSGTLMAGMAGRSPGTLIVGTIGAEAVDTGIAEGLGSALAAPSRLDGRLLLDSSSFSSSSLGFQPVLKLTIGLPGRSLTAVGVGNFGLRSFILMLVAARISSPRTSISFFEGGVVVAPASLTSGRLGKGALDV